jgi:hypothetical protein
MAWKTTIVTMFYDLSKLNDCSNQTRTSEFYLNYGRGTLSIPNPMVIFCAPDMRSKIETIRNELVNPDEIPTVYVEQSITDYDFYKINHPIITANRKGSHIYTKGHRNTASYCLLTMFKPIALQIAFEQNNFDTDYYAWIDFGCNHINNMEVRDTAMQVLNNPRPKIGVLYIHYHSLKELSDMTRYVPGGPCGIAATAFTLEKAYVSKFYNCMVSIFHEQVMKGVGHSEETVMIYCHSRYPELFTVHYGDYQSVLTNYHSIHENYHTIKYHFIENALNEGDITVAKDAAEKVLTSVQKGTLAISDAEVAWISNILSMESNI